MTRMQRGLLAIMVGCAGAALGGDPETGGRTSLTNTPFIHPRLVEELVTWVSDGGDQIVALDLDKSEGSNRFCCDDAGGGTSYSRNQDENGEGYPAFSYGVIGRTDSGVYVLHTYSNDGGSGGWHNLILVVLEEDPGLKIDLKAGKAEMTRPRRVMKKLGQTFLGDRWKGQLKVEGNKLYIGKDHGWLSENSDSGEVKERSDDWESVVEITYPSLRDAIP